MKAREFLDLLRVYPDLDVDITIRDGNSLIDIEDIYADERNGNLYIMTTKDEALSA